MCPSSSHIEDHNNKNASFSTNIATRTWEICWILNVQSLKNIIYTASQKHESTLLHTYVLNEYLSADR